MIHTGKVDLSLDLSTNIIYLTFSASGENEEEHYNMALETRDKYAQIKKDNPNKKFRVLVDLSNADVPSDKARDIYIKTLSDKQIMKTAFFGVGSAIKSIVSFIVSASGKGDDVRFFIDRDDAMKWLNE